MTTPDLSTPRPSQAELDAIFLPRISDRELADLAASNPPLKRMCRGCAYRPGTEAASDPNTSQKRADCDRTGHPFWCHMHKNRLDLPMHLCAGWMNTRSQSHEG